MSTDGNGSCDLQDGNRTSLLDPSRLVRCNIEAWRRRRAVPEAGFERGRRFCSPDRIEGAACRMVWPNSSSVDTMNEDSSAVICTYSTRKLHFFGSVEATHLSTANHFRGQFNAPLRQTLDASEPTN